LPLTKITRNSAIQPTGKKRCNRH